VVDATKSYREAISSNDPFFGVTRHAKYVTFQLAEVAVPRRLFAAILDRITQLAIPPPRTSACVN